MEELIQNGFLGNWNGRYFKVKSRLMSPPSRTVPIKQSHCSMCMLVHSCYIFRGSVKTTLV